MLDADSTLIGEVMCYLGWPHPGSAYSAVRVHLLLVLMLLQSSHLVMGVLCAQILQWIRPSIVEQQEPVDLGTDPSFQMSLPV